MIEARIDVGGEAELYRSEVRGDGSIDGNLKFVRFGKRPYRMAEFHPEAMFYIPSIMRMSWICIEVEEFIEDMDDLCRRKKGFFDPPV